MNKRKNKVELSKVRNEIRRYLTLGVTPIKIKEYMKMAERTFNWHIHAIYDEDKIAHDDNTSNKDKLEAERLKKETSIDLIRLLRDSPTQVMLEYEHDEGSKPTNVREQLSAD